MRLTVPSPEFVTQTDPAPTAMPAGDWPTRMGEPAIAGSRGSTRVTAGGRPGAEGRGLPRSVTHTPPAPAASRTGTAPGTRSADPSRRPVLASTLTRAIGLASGESVLA